MALAIELEAPERVLARGEHAGFAWLVAHNGAGTRCGYIRVPPGHRWHCKGPGEIGGILVHGGITYSDADVYCGPTRLRQFRLTDGVDGWWWLGFDTAHAGDAVDPELMTDLEPMAKIAALTVGSLFAGVIRSTQYVADQCRCLCEQAGVVAHAI